MSGHSTTFSISDDELVRIANGLELDPAEPIEEFLARFFAEAGQDQGHRIGDVTLIDWSRIEPGARAPTHLGKHTYDLLRGVEEQHPELGASLFERCAEVGGLYIPADRVVDALVWVKEARARGLEAGWLRDPRQLSPIVRALEDALDNGCAYLEARSVFGAHRREVARFHDAPLDLVRARDEGDEEVFRRIPETVEMLGVTPLGPVLYRPDLDETEVPIEEWIDDHTGEIHEHDSIPGRVAPAPVEVVTVGDDTYALTATALVRTRRGSNLPEEVVPVAGEGGSLAPGPAGTIIVCEGPNREGRIGGIYLPDEGRWVVVAHDLIGLEEVGGLAYDARARSLVATAAPFRAGGRSMIKWTALLGGGAPVARAARELDGRIVIPWFALGWPRDLPEPMRCAACWMSDEDIEALTGGRVRSAAAFDPETRRPTAGGLHDEALFGRGRYAAIELPRARPSRLAWCADPDLASRMHNRLVPVVPPAFRPTIERGDGTAHPGLLTQRYGALVEAIARADDDAIDLAATQLWNQLAATIELGPLTSIDETLAANPQFLRATSWPTPWSEIRAALYAMGVELVPLTDGGEIDQPRLRAVRYERRSAHVDEVLGTVLGARYIDEVKPTAHPTDVPTTGVLIHVDREDRAVFTTVGASAWPQRDGTRFEVVCLSRRSLTPAQCGTIARGIAICAAGGHRSGNPIGPLQTVRFDQPLGPGSKIAGFYLDLWLGPEAERIRELLPDRPRLLVAVGLSEEQLARAMGDMVTVGMELHAAGHITDPRL